MLLPEWRQWSLEKLGVANRPIAVDLFASPTMTAAPQFITRDMDAFTYNWSKLNAIPHTILWANPPFHALDKVVEKIQMEPCTIALCTPNWPDRTWFPQLSNIYMRRIELPTKRRLYLGVNKKTPLQQRQWHTIVWLVSTKEMPRLLKTPNPTRLGKDTSDLYSELWELHKKKVSTTLHTRTRCTNWRMPKLQNSSFHCNRGVARTNPGPETQRKGPATQRH